MFSHTHCAMRGVIGILLRQGAQEGADVFSVAVRNQQAGIANVELDLMAHSAILLVCDFQMINTRGIRFVAIGAFQLPPLPHNPGWRKVQFMIKL